MKKIPLVPNEFLLSFVLITSLFFMWGLANNMTDTLLAAFKKIMSMNDAKTSLIQVAFYSSYGILALPAAIFIWKYSYKSGLLLGLGLFISGALLFYPASLTMSYNHFLIALFILAGGLSILETTANPYIIAIGPAETGTRRLNLAQSFNPMGSLSGVALSAVFILSNLNQATEADRLKMSSNELAKIQSAELSAVMGPYVAVALFLILLWIIIAFVKMPKIADEDSDIRQILKRLMKNKNYMLGVFMQFLYVGSQIGVWSFTIRYAMKELSIIESDASIFYISSLVSFIAARWIFTYLMKYITPLKLLAFSAIMAVVASGLTSVLSGYWGVVSLVAVSAFMSLMFPTIFGISVKGLGKDTKIAGSGHIMAIIGGAVITFFQGQVSDLTGSIKLSYLVPTLCFIVIVIYSFTQMKKEKV